MSRLAHPSDRPPVRPQARLSIALVVGLLGASLAVPVLAAPKVELGIDVLLAPGSPHAAALAGKRLGLITNPSGVDGQLVPTADRLARDRRMRLVQLYGPEHGIRGEVAAGEKVDDARDPVTGLPVQSLYGRTRRPTAESLAGIDALLFDIQDIGSRTYTYISTLGEAMHACAEHRKPLWVLDRPNPIGGRLAEGPVMPEQWRNFIGWGPMPVTHGMTVGEVARFFKDSLGIACDLHVVPMRGWRRSMAWADTGLLWTQTSPHIPGTVQAHLYVATGMVAMSTTNLSDGVGTTLPFEVVVADFLDGPRLAAALAAEGLPGVRFQALAVKPFYGTFKDQPMRGVRLHLMDAQAFEPLRTAVTLLAVIERLHPGRIAWAEEKVIGRHWGETTLPARLRAGEGAESITAGWRDGMQGFLDARRAALLYR
jgi:uncharacterized protein YbbC (DUF1343 family)